MTTYIYHGDDTHASRNNLFQQRQKSHNIKEINGEKTNAIDLSTSLATNNLFDTETILIDNLFSRPRSKEKDAAITVLSNYAGTKEILCWEKKAITKAVLAKLPKNWIIKESKPPALLFNFLDNIFPGNSQQAVNLFHELLNSSHEPAFIFIMLTRHINSLISAQSATNLRLPPWQIGKLKQQASKFSEAQLIYIVDKLFQIDLCIKSGKTKLDLQSQLDILLLQALG